MHLMVLASSPAVSRCFFHPQTGVPVIPPDPITILDFRTNLDVIRVLKPTYPRDITPIPPSEKIVVFTVPEV